MAAQQILWKKTRSFAMIGMLAIMAGVVMMVFLLSTPAQGNALHPAAVLTTGLLITQQEPPQHQFQPQAQPATLQVGDSASTAIAALVAQPGQQPANVNGRFVYAVPAVVGPDATAILQNILPDAVVYAVHPLVGWGKSVSTTVSWFRCADIVNASQYNGSQVEIETWTLLTQQERMEAQVACSLSTIGG